MAQPPPHAARWLERRYPRPKVDQEWLQGCCEWLSSQPGADPSSQKFLGDIEEQLLQSDFRDSMLQGTGLPAHIIQPDNEEANTRLAGLPVLVEIAAITEIASSAYQLEQIRSAREERMRSGQLEDENDEREGDLEVEGEGPMPKYPRGMLRFELSDGTTTLNAIEYRPIPELSLEKTPLGYKMLLKNPMMRHGIAFLEPNTIVLKGFKTPDREALRWYDLARGLRVRMGLPIDLPSEDATQTQPPPQVPRSPLREISAPPAPPINPAHNDDADLGPRRRKLPATNIISPTPDSTSATLVPSLGTNASSYFSHPSSSPQCISASGLNLGLTPAQASHLPLKDTNDNDNDDLFKHFDNIGFLDGMIDESNVDENAPPAQNFSKPLPFASGNILPFSSLSGQSSSTHSLTTSSKESGAERPSSREDSIEILSSAPSQAISKAQREERAEEKDRLHTPPMEQHTRTKGKGRRPIAPLPRHFLASQTQSEPPITTDVEVINITSSSSSSSSPKNVYDSDSDFDIGDTEDSIEEEDKENMPVMTRHVRRKVMDGGEGDSNVEFFTGEEQTPIISSEIIDLSDEDWQESADFH